MTSNELVEKTTTKPVVLLHACCGPCSTTAIERLQAERVVKVCWYNPNIEPKSEHDMRLENLKKVAAHYNASIFADYDWETENRKWHHAITGLESEPEGGKRCAKCFEFRLAQAAKQAKNSKSPFTTSLTVSPHKKSRTIFEIAEKLATNFDVRFLVEDFKKKDGYSRSIELSKKLGIYRQEYCGCLFSKAER